MLPGGSHNENPICGAGSRLPAFRLRNAASQMTRYKGRFSVNAIERDFPHIVEMAVPPRGFGSRLDTMYEWHRSRSIEGRRGRGRHEDDQDYVRWCFSDAYFATSFAAEFGGTVISEKLVPKK